MFWIIFRITIYISIFALIWFGGQFYVSQELSNGLREVSPHALFVDQKILKNEVDAKQQNGSITYPFSTIESALQVAQEKNIKTIFINSGTYHETLIIPENIILFGKGDVIITAPQKGSYDIIKPKNNTSIINLTLDGGDNGVSIEEKTNVRLYNVTIKNAKDFGIEMDIEDERRNSQNKLIPTYNILYKTKEELAQIPLVRISNSIITQNGSQGLYLSDGRVEIENTKVIKNGEEGIDLHPHMYATINNVLSQNNGEGGLESEIYDNIVTITNSTFDGNIKSGVAFITHIGTGQIILKNNIITNNQKYGMRCALHKKRPEKPKPFFQTTIQRENNLFENNALGDISYQFCYTF